jgi:hypothetical protein
MGSVRWIEAVLEEHAAQTKTWSRACAPLEPIVPRDAEKFRRAVALLCESVNFMNAKLEIVAFLLALSACGSPPPQETTPAPAAEPPETAQPGPTATPSVAEPPVPAGPAPTLAVTGTPASIGRTVAISVTNRGAGDVQLSTELGLEVERDGAFVDAEHPGLRLRYDCAQDTPACVTLAPGSELLPPDWLGTWGDVQCVCTRCGPAEPGRYRFVVRTCDGAHRVEGTPFTLAP